MASAKVESLSEVVVDLTEEGPLRVLHVDDQGGFLKAAKRILELQSALRVETALSVEEATEKMEKETFDAIVCDYVMPGKDGLEFLEELRRKGNNIPFIVFTGKGREEVAIRALNLGADRYLNKTGHSEAVYGELAHSIRKTVKARRVEEEARKLSSAVMQSLDGIAIGDLEPKLTYVNEAFAKMHGYSPEEMIGMNVVNLHNEEQTEEYKKGMTQIKTQGSWSGEIEHIRKDGTPFPTYMSVTLLRDTGGKPTGILAICRDITERIRAKEALRESEERLNAMLQSIGDHMSMMDKDLNILWANETAKRIFGDDIIGKKCYEAYHGRKKPCEPHPCLTLQAFQDGKVHEHDTQVVDEAGKTVYFHCTASVALRDKEGNSKAVIEISRDVTEEKKAQQKIEAEKQKLETYFKSMADGVSVTDENGAIVQVNEAAAKMYGFESPAEMIGKKIFQFVAKSDLPRVKRRYLQAVNDKNLIIKNLEIMARRNDGSEFPVLISSANLLDEEGKIVGNIGIVKDITEIKETQGRLKMANEKLETVGSLTRHDIRNKLSAVSGNIFLIRQTLGKPEAVEYLNEIESAVKQIERILEFARTYERIGVEELGYVDVTRSVDDAISFFSDLQGVRVLNECQGFTVLADALFSKLFYNLIDNSLKYGEKVSQIRVYYKTGKDEVELFYEDNGVGIPKSEKEKIFKEGYGKGTGYGLYLIKKMCDAYGWSIKETGKPGQGARFTTIIPKETGSGKAGYKLH